MRTAARTLVQLVLLLLMSPLLQAGGDTETGTGGNTSKDGPQDLPAIGGAQDVWPFGFGFEAGYEDVREALGEPVEVLEEGAAGGGPVVVRWRYDEVTVTFVENPDLERVIVLTVRFTGEGQELRGGLSLGMPIERARELMGEPQVVNEEAHVYFYNTTTIELLVIDGLVREIQVARALP